MHIAPKLRRIFVLLTLTLISMPVYGAPPARPSGAGHTVRAGGGPLGLGIVLGDPTGFTGKYWTGPRTAFDGGLAFAFGDYFLVYGDYLYHFPGALGSTSAFTEALTPYVGFGALVAFSTGDHYYHENRRVIFRDSDSSVGLGLRIPLGIEWKPPDVPLGVFVELVPGMSVTPNTSAFLEGGIGARYYF
jgi:hypothetical protein